MVTEFREKYMPAWKEMQAFDALFEDLQFTSSRNEKQEYVEYFKRTYPQYVNDLNLIFETLDGRHPIGWTFTPSYTPCQDYIYWRSIGEILCMCFNVPDHTVYTTLLAERDAGMFGEFIEGIVNRTLKLGIGKSQLSTTDVTPMLAKKFEGEMLRDDVFVTEKLDGNRCVASFVDGEWRFTSRSGKSMKVNFDMTGMNTDYIYDGEVMSKAQTDLSINRYLRIVNAIDGVNKWKEVDTQKAQLMFNETSGLINRKGVKSGLIYNIFDIICDKSYAERRDMLNKMIIVSPDIRILPLLYVGNDVGNIDNLLCEITSMGGEGVMLNFDAKYEHKRTGSLLKYKQVQFMDMKVVDILPGTGKYTGLAGAISCYIKTDDGKEIRCDVGSGLSDVEREEWWYNPDAIRNKIVQIGYHELTQSSEQRGTDMYSLRFPRLIKVRRDKNVTSEY